FLRRRSGAALVNRHSRHPTAAGSGASAQTLGGMNVRDARPAESEELSALAASAKALWGYSPQQIALWSRELRILRESIVSEPTFVAEERARPVGVAQLDTKQFPGQSS